MWIKDLTKYCKTNIRKYMQIFKKWSRKDAFKQDTNKAIFLLENPAKFNFINIKLYL